MRIVPDPASRRAAIEAGELDLATQISAADVTDLETQSAYCVERSAAGAIDFLVYPAYLEPFTNADVRRGIDRLIPARRLSKTSTLEWVPSRTRRFRRFSRSSPSTASIPIDSARRFRGRPLRYR